jgi:hypothetical protein
VLSDVAAIVVLAIVVVAVVVAVVSLFACRVGVGLADVTGCVAAKRLRFTDDLPLPPLLPAVGVDNVAVSVLFNFPFNDDRLELSFTSAVSAVAVAVAVVAANNERLVVVSVFGGVDATTPELFVVGGGIAAHGLGIISSVVSTCFVVETSAVVAFFDCRGRFCFTGVVSCVDVSVLDCDAAVFWLTSAFVAALEVPERLEMAVILAIVEFAFLPLPPFVVLCLVTGVVDGVDVFVSFVGTTLVVSVAAIETVEDGAGDSGGGGAIDE